MANLPDKPMSSVMLTRLKQFTAMSKFKVSAASCPQTACKPQLNIHRSFPSMVCEPTMDLAQLSLAVQARRHVSPPPCSKCHQFTNPPSAHAPFVAHATLVTCR